MRAKRESGSHPYVLVLGAGASVASGTSLNRAVVERVVGTYDLKAFDAYLAQCSDDERFTILRDLVEGTSPSKGYQSLVELIRAGYFDVILSTNFDPLLEDAIAELPMRRRDYVFLVHGVMDPELVADHLDNKEPSTAEGYTCRFDPRPARYIRVTQPHNSANTGRHLVEVAAYALSAQHHEGEHAQQRSEWHVQAVYAIHHQDEGAAAPLRDGAAGQKGEGRHRLAHDDDGAAERDKQQSEPLRRRSPARRRGRSNEARAESHEQPEDHVDNRKQTEQGGHPRVDVVADDQHAQLFLVLDAPDILAHAYWLVACHFHSTLRDERARGQPS